MEKKAVAEQELSNPTEDSQRIQVGDAWYQATKKGGPAIEKNAMLGRAQFWYLQAKTLTGVQKERVTQRLAEIDKTLPLDPDNIDYQSLTPTQWAKLKGAESIVPASMVCGFAATCTGSIDFDAMTGATAAFGLGDSSHAANDIAAAHTAIHFFDMAPVCLPG